MKAAAGQVRVCSPFRVGRGINLARLRAGELWQLQLDIAGESLLASPNVRRADALVQFEARETVVGFRGRQETVFKGGRM